MLLAHFLLSSAQHNFFPRPCITGDCISCRSIFSREGALYSLREVVCVCAARSSEVFLRMKPLCSFVSCDTRQRQMPSRLSSALLSGGRTASTKNAAYSTIRKTNLRTFRTLDCRWLRQFRTSRDMLPAGKRWTPPVGFELSMSHLCRRKRHPVLVR